MKLRVNFVLAGAVMAFAMLSGASAQTTEADIAARLVDKPLLLRGFWAQDKLRFHADGTPVDLYAAESFTESAIDVKAVHLRDDSLFIEGQRVGLRFDRDGNMSRVPMFGKGLLSSPEKISIHIEGTAGSDYQQATHAIFADNPAEIADSLPECWQPYARQHFLHEKAGGIDTSSGDGPRNADPAVHIGGSVKPPRVVHQVDPAFSQAARHVKLSGSSQLYLWLEPSGLPDHIRIMKPLGLGLDERAVAAVQQYRFAPATKDGTPVKVDLYIDVNFQIF